MCSAAMSVREKSKKRKRDTPAKESKKLSGKVKSQNDSPLAKKLKVNKGTLKPKLEGSDVLNVSHRPAPQFDDSDPTSDFESFLNPLLENGQEVSLYEWMLGFNLLKKPAKCSKSGCDQSLLHLAESRILKDKYAWECAECKNKNLSIRTGTIFSSLKCSIHVALQVVRAWCIQLTPENAEKQFEIKLSDVRKIYQICFDVMNIFMKTSTAEAEVLGGSNSVVLLDMWPNGLLPAPGSARDTKRRWGERLRVVWLADTKHVPVRYWAKVLPPMKTSSQLREMDIKLCKELQSNTKHNRKSKKNLNSEKVFQFKKNKLTKPTERRLSRRNHPCSQSENKPPRDQSDESVKKPKRKILSHDQNKECRIRMDFRELKRQEENHRVKEMLNAVVEVAKHHIAPSSLILANERALPGVCDALVSTGRYETVMSTYHILAVKSRGHRETLDILKNIWRTATNVCKELQHATRISAHGKLVEFLWRQRYDTGGSKSFFHILRLIAIYSNLQSASNSAEVEY